MNARGEQPDVRDANHSPRGAFREAAETYALESR